MTNVHLDCRGDGSSNRNASRDESVETGDESVEAGDESIEAVEFQRCPLKFHTKLWTHTQQIIHFTDCYFGVSFMISLNSIVISLCETGPIYTSTRMLHDSDMPWTSFSMM